MKKLILYALILVLAVPLAGCAQEEAPAAETTAATLAPTEAPATEAPTEPPSPYMTHEEFLAAPLDALVTVETYVQASQSWWDNTISLYCQGPDGAYFLYNAACSEADAAKLVKGTKIAVTGYKEVFQDKLEILSATFEFLEGEPYLPEPADVTALLGTEELMAHQNELVCFKGLTVEALEYEEEGSSGDLRVTFSYNEESCEFLVEHYLFDEESDLYKQAEALKPGKAVDVEAFLHWENGPLPHITAIAPAA